MVSAFVAENQLTLGEILVDEKTNEMKAAPELLDLITIEDSIVTTDAMSCHKEIAEKIAKQKEDYIFALKDNQPQLKQDISDFFQRTASNEYIWCTPIFKNNRK